MVLFVVMGRFSHVRAARLRWRRLTGERPCSSSSRKCSSRVSPASSHASFVVDLDSHPTGSGEFHVLRRTLPASAEALLSLCSARAAGLRSFRNSASCPGSGGSARAPRAAVQRPKTSYWRVVGRARCLRCTPSRTVAGYRGAPVSSAVPQGLTSRHVSPASSCRRLRRPSSFALRRTAVV